MASVNPYQWVSTARLAADAALLAAKLPPDISAVVGLPRSGMMPAAVIATHRHLPLWQLTGDGQLTRLGHGQRADAVPRDGPLAVIDDTVYAGTAMTWARAYLRGRRAIYAAVYVRPEAAKAVDIYARAIPCPHLLEWNLVNTGAFAGHAAPTTRGVFGRGVALDFDGVICHDAESGGDLGSPYLLPQKFPCRLIATGRPERSRPQTEAWLRQWGVRWERLEMLPDDTPLSVESAAAHKARHFAASGCGFFVESCPVQADAIHRLTGKPVVCPAEGKVYQ